MESYVEGFKYEGGTISVDYALPESSENSDGEIYVPQKSGLVYEPRLKSVDSGLESEASVVSFVSKFENLKANHSKEHEGERVDFSFLEDDSDGVFMECSCCGKWIGLSDGEYPDRDMISP